MQRTPEQLREQIKRHKQLQKEWATAARDARSKGQTVIAKFFDGEADNHKRSEMIAKSELEAMR